MTSGIAAVDLDAAAVDHTIAVLQAGLRRRGVAICISGVDGSGKTTLAETLLRILGHEGIPVRHLHVYQWFRNIVVTPCVLLHNRFVGREVLIFDRSIYDNIAVLATRRQCPDWCWRLLLALVHVCYPRFDHCLYLVATDAQTRQRRPETDMAQLASLRAAYGAVSTRVGHATIESNAQVANAALRVLGGGRNVK